MLPIRTGRRITNVDAWSQAVVTRAHVCEWVTSTTEALAAKCSVYCRSSGVGHTQRPRPVPPSVGRSTMQQHVCKQISLHGISNSGTCLPSLISRSSVTTSALVPVPSATSQPASTTHTGTTTAWPCLTAPCTEYARLELKEHVSSSSSSSICPRTKNSMTMVGWARFNVLLDTV